MAKERTQFCIECREETMYRIQPVSCRKCIKDKEYEFIISEAVCEKCGETVNIPGIMDSNAQEVDRQYRLQEGIVSIDDICDLMEIYKIGKAPLSLALGSSAAERRTSSEIFGSSFRQPLPPRYLVRFPQ